MVRGTLVARLMNVAEEPTPPTEELCREAAERIQELERWHRAAFENRRADKTTYRGRNYNLCTAIDLTKLSISVDELLAAGANAKAVNYFQGVIRDALDMLRLQNPEDKKS